MLFIIARWVHVRRRGHLVELGAETDVGSQNRTDTNTTRRTGEQKGIKTFSQDSTRHGSSCYGMTDKGRQCLRTNDSRNRNAWLRWAVLLLRQCTRSRSIVPQHSELPTIPGNECSIFNSAVDCLAQQYGRKFVQYAI